jgi:hypothetical protein
MANINRTQKGSIYVERSMVSRLVVFKFSGVSCELFEDSFLV